MSLQEVYYIAEIIVGFSVIISIVFVAIELRQNTYMMRKSMADERSARINWVSEAICLDKDFRNFHHRIGTEWDQMTEDDLYRAHWLGIRTLRPLLNELIAYFDGQISDTEFQNLRWNLQVAKSRPQFVKVYETLKAGYPKNIRKFWEELDMTNGPILTTGGLPISNAQTDKD